MKEKVAGAADKIKGFFKGLGKRTRILLGAGLGLVLVLLVAAVVFMNNQPYEPLFVGLTSSDTQSILTYLEQNGVTDYKVQGDSVLVPKAQEERLKAQLILAGYPKSGFGYDIYMGNVGALSTDADRQNALRFDLQERLSGVIRCLDGVKDAHVTINMGEDQRFVLSPTNIKATAGIIVQMQEGHSLSKEQAAAIRNLVAKSVKGLDIEEIALSDNYGNSFNVGDSADKISDSAQLRLFLEEQESNKARTEILRQLNALYGEDNVKVSVSCTVDVNRRVGESTTYTSPEGAADGRGIIGREVYQREVVSADGELVGGVVGTQSNADLPNYVQDGLGDAANNPYAFGSGEIDSKVNENREQVEYLSGTVTDMMVTVTINATTAGAVDVTRLSEHVATAARISPEQRVGRVSILVQPFYQPDQPIGPGGEVSDLVELPQWAIYAAIGGGVLFLVLLVLILILRGKAKKKKKARLAQQMIEEAGITFIPDNDQSMGADIMTIRNEKSMELRKEIRQFAENNPEIAAQLVKSWLRGGDDGNG